MNLCKSFLKVSIIVSGIRMLITFTVLLVRFRLWSFFDFSSVCHRLHSCLAHFQHTNFYFSNSMCVQASTVKVGDQLCCAVSGTKCSGRDVDVLEIESSRKRAWWDGEINRDADRPEWNENIPTLDSLTRPDVLVRHVSTPHGPAGNKRPNSVHLEALVLPHKQMVNWPFRRRGKHLVCSAVLTVTGFVLEIWWVRQVMFNSIMSAHHNINSRWVQGLSNT